MSPTLLFLFPFLLYVLSPTVLSQSPDVLTLLTKLKPSLLGPTPSNLQLSSWNASLPLCRWRGLTWAFPDASILPCDDPLHNSNLSLYKNPSLQLTSIRLPASGLAGSVPEEIGLFSSLETLLLGVNELRGGIPFAVGNCPGLVEVDLSGNRLEGALPVSIWNLCGRVVSLKVRGNRLRGVVPEPAVSNVTCGMLVDLDLGENRFEGVFPEFVVGFDGLRRLDVGGNFFSGPIPAQLARLERLNLSFNNFSGSIPDAFRESKFGADVFQGNAALCGAPLEQCGVKSGLSSGMVAGIVIGLMAGAVVLASLSIGYVQGRKGKNRGVRIGEEDELEQEEDGGGDGKLVVFQGGEHLTLEDVLNATGQVIEKTSYGTVYKARLADGGTIALRLLREGSSKDRESCLPVIRQLGRVRQENLVPMRAFYQGQRGEKLLIYDYLPNRTLHDLLHENRAARPLLNWARRHKIALGIARGLAYLHTGLDNPITHGNVRSKNVLVDDFFVARLTEYGLDKVMVPAVADEMVSTAKTEGYKAPELQKMKKCNPRTDVCAFGILLLEILMGKKPGKDEKNGGMVDLPALVKVAVLEETTMELFDVEIFKGIRNPMEDGLVHALKLAMGCCAPVATVRPTMDEVVKQLEENRPRNRSALYSPADTRSEIGTPF